MAYKGPKEIIGPNSTTDNTIPRFNGISGDILQDSSVTIDDNNIMTGITSLTVDDVSINNNIIETPTDTNLILSPQGDGLVSLSKGLTFDSGTNTLDTFLEKSNFTPTLSFGGGSTGIAYSVREGRFNRIGDQVFFNIFIILTSKGSSTGNANVNLPVNVGESGPSSCRWGNIKLGTGYTFLTPEISDSDNRIEFQVCGDNVLIKILNNLDFLNSSKFEIYGWYYA